MRSTPTLSVQTEINSDKNRFSTEQAASVKSKECRQSGSSEACLSTALVAKEGIVEGTLKTLFTGAKRKAEVELTTHLHGSAEVLFGHVEADASMHFEKGKNKIELGAGAWLAKFDGELGTSEFCINSLNTCYQLNLQASGGIGWENSIALGLDRNPQKTTIKMGSGMGPVKWSAILKMTHKDPAKTHLSKTIALPERTAEKLAKHLLPVSNEILGREQEIAFKLIDSSSQFHLRNFAKQYAQILFLKITTEKPSRYEMNRNWLNHKDEILSAPLKIMEASDAEAYLFTRLVEEEYYTHEHLKDLKITTTSSEAKTAIKSITKTAKTITAEFENREGDLYKEYQKSEVEFHKADLKLLQDKKSQAKIRQVFNDMSEISVTAGWIARFADNTELSNSLFTLGQAALAIPNVISTASQSFGTLQGLFAGAIPLSLTSTLSVFSPLAPAGALIFLLTNVFSSKSDNASLMMQQVCAYLNDLIQPLYVGMNIMHQKQDFMISMQKVLHEQVEYLFLNQDQIGDLLLENFSFIRRHMDISQKLLIEKSTEVLLGIEGIRSLIQEFRQDDITIIKELVESALELGEGALEDCLRQLNCFVAPFIKAKAAVTSHALTAGEKEISKENIQSILISLRHSHLATAYNSINLIQDYLLTQNVDSIALLPQRKYQKLSNSVGLYLLIDILQQVVSDLHKRNKSIKRIFPGIEKHLKWGKEETNNLIHFIEETNQPFVVRMIFKKTSELLNKMEFQINALKISYAKENEDKAATKHAPIILAEKQFLEREASYQPIITFTDYNDYYHKVMAPLAKESLLKTLNGYLKGIHENNMYFFNLKLTNSPITTMVYPENNLNGLGLYFSHFLNKIFNLDDFIKLEKWGVGYLKAIYSVNSDKTITFKVHFHFYDKIPSLLIGTYTDLLKKMTTLHHFAYPNLFPPITMAYDDSSVATFYWSGVIADGTETYSPHYRMDEVPDGATLINQISAEQRAAILNKYERENNVGFARRVKDAIQAQEMPIHHFNLHLTMLKLLLMLKDSQYAKKMDYYFSQLEENCNLIQYIENEKLPNFLSQCRYALLELQKRYPVYIYSEDNLLYQSQKMITDIETTLIDNEDRKKSTETVTPIISPTPADLVKDSFSNSASKAAAPEPLLMKPISWIRSVLSATFSSAKQPIFHESKEEKLEKEAECKRPPGKTFQLSEDVLETLRVTHSHRVAPTLSGVEVAQVAIPIVVEICKKHGLFGYQLLSPKLASQNEMQYGEQLDEIEKSLDEMKDRPTIGRRLEYHAARTAFDVAELHFRKYFLNPRHSVTTSENIEVSKLIDEAQQRLTMIEALAMQLDEQYPGLDAVILSIEKQQNNMYVTLNKFIHNFDIKIKKFNKQQDVISAQLNTDGLSKNIEDKLNAEWDELENCIAKTKDEKEMAQEAIDAIIFILNQNADILKSDCLGEEIESIEKNLHLVKAAVKEMQLAVGVDFVNKGIVSKLIAMVNTIREEDHTIDSLDLEVSQSSVSSMGIFSTVTQLAASVFSRNRPLCKHIPKIIGKIK